MGNKTTPPPDDRVLYLAFKNICKDHHATIRNSKPIMKLILQYQNHESVGALVREHSIDVVCASLQKLLVKKVFSSTLKAKIHFPELFEPSPGQSAEREASEAAAAKHDAESIQEAAASRLDERGLPDQSGQSGGPSGKVIPVLDNEECATSPAEAKGKEPMRLATEEALNSVQPLVNTRASLLFPIYIPFESQHILLNHLQAELERACFDYGVLAMPEIFSERLWDCAEALELNLWIEEVIKRDLTLPGVGNTGKGKEKLLRGIANIRHTAVHRVRVRARAIEQFLLDAEAFVSILGGESHVRSISRLLQKYQMSVEELERNKHFLQSRLDDTLRDISEQRAKLQRMEEQAVADMMREDMEYKAIAGSFIEGSVVGADGSERSFSTAFDGVDDAVHMNGSVDMSGPKMDEREEEVPIPKADS